MPRSCLVAGTRCGDYVLLRKIGEGASGFVFAADSLKHGAVLALKFVHLNNSYFRKEYAREIDTLQKIGHSKYFVRLIEHFRVGIYGVLVFDKYPFDLLEYMEQETLDFHDIRYIFTSVCLGVQQMHSHCIAHLDIKPENIFITKNKQVKIGDFGSSFEWSESTPRKFGRSGTTYYCAPEIKQRDSYHPGHADIWSLGILLHVMCTGHWPYSATSSKLLRRNIEEGRVELTSSKLPEDPNLYFLLKNILQHSPADRLEIVAILSSSWMLVNDFSDEDINADESYDRIDIDVKEIPSSRRNSFVDPPSLEDLSDLAPGSISQPDLQEISQLTQVPEEFEEFQLVPDFPNIPRGKFGGDSRRSTWSAMQILKRFKKGKGKKDATPVCPPQIPEESVCTENISKTEAF